MATPSPAPTPGAPSTQSMAALAAGMADRSGQRPPAISHHSFTPPIGSPAIADPTEPPDARCAALLTSRRGTRYALHGRRRPDGQPGRMWRLWIRQEVSLRVRRPDGLGGERLVAVDSELPWRSYGVSGPELEAAGVPAEIQAEIGAVVLDWSRFEAWMRDMEAVRPPAALEQAGNIAAQEG